MKKQVELFIKEQLKTNNTWAKRALVRIYEFQTLEEQNKGTTLKRNNVGFSGADATILSSLADFYLTKGFLTEKQTALLKKKIYHYWKQVWEISDQTTITNLAMKGVSK